MPYKNDKWNRYSQIIVGGQVFMVAKKSARVHHQGKEPFQVTKMKSSEYQ
jgi:hypothetical protein